MKDGLDFERAMEKLEEITKRLEDGNESLESSIELYQEGMSLSKYCMDELNNAEQRIRVIEANNSWRDDENDI